MHPSVIEGGQELRYTGVPPLRFGCPLCPIFTTRSESSIKRHLVNHVANAVHFKDKIICRCNLHCGGGSHFHCVFCGTTIIRKDAITTHLMECQIKCDVVQPSQLPPPEAHPAAVFTSMPAMSAVKMDHSYTQTESQKTPAVAPAQPEEPDLSQSPPAATSELPLAPEKLETQDVPPTHVNLLSRDVQRKHRKTNDITAQSPLQSTSADHNNGLCAVRKPSRRFSFPVHVQHKTWGQLSLIRREIEDSGLYHLLAQQIDLSYIRSLGYCTTTFIEEQLDHQVLQEMVKKHFFADSEVTLCKTRQ